jgi:hypothetical protein
MKRNFYCVTSEYHDDGTVEAAIIYGLYKQKPANSEETTREADRYKDWYFTEEAAAAALRQIHELRALSVDRLHAKLFPLMDARIKREEGAASPANP